MLHYSILLAQVDKVSSPVITDDVWMGRSRVMASMIVVTFQTKSQGPVVSMGKGVISESYTFREYLPIEIN